jgi:hypothetical protein
MANSSGDIERPAEPWTYPYVAGALDFGGSITNQVSKAEDTRVGYSIVPAIKFHKTNPTVLGFLDEFCQEHNLKPGFRDEPTNYVLRIGRRADIEKLLRLVEPYMIAKVEPAMILLNEILPGLNDRRHSSKKGFIELMGYVDDVKRCSEATDKLSDAKYTQEYFRDEWDME